LEELLETITSRADRGIRKRLLSCNTWKDVFLASKEIDDEAIYKGKEKFNFHYQSKNEEHERKSKLKNELYEKKRTI
jgi:hypothetical protein